MIDFETVPPQEGDVLLTSPCCDRPLTWNSADPYLTSCTGCGQVYDPRFLSEEPVAD